MTPKEKAELIWSRVFQEQISLTGILDGNLCVELSSIVIDEIIENLWDNKISKEFYQQVKHELNKSE